MTKRSVQEIEQEITECKIKRRELHDANYCSETYHWRNYGAVKEINKITHHIRNLYLELNRAKQRDWIEGR